MTVVVKGIDMPRDCPMCPVAHYNAIAEFTGCEVVPGKRYAMSNDPEYRNSSIRPDWCPLIEVPAPHGRLIDADDFDSRIRAAGGQADEELTDDFKDGVLTVLALMETQNTVIEAEEVNND